jgi:hypothetical protein
MIFLGGSMPSLARTSRCTGGELGALPERTGRPFQGADVQFLQVLANVVRGVAGGGLDDADQE